MSQGIHRIQVDFDIKADCHQDAVELVMDKICRLTQEFTPDGCMDMLVLEENEEACPCCSDPKFYVETQLRQYKDRGLLPADF